MDNPTMPDPRPADDSGRNSSSEWTIERGLISRSQLQPPATDSLLQPALADDTSLLEESEVLLALRQKIGKLEGHLQEAKRDVDRKADEVKRLKQEIADFQKKRKALARKENRSRIEALERENRSLKQKLDQAQKDEKLSKQKVDTLGLKLDESEIEKGSLVSRVEALEREKKSLELQKLDQAQKGEELPERMVDALYIEKRSPGQKPEQSRQKELLGRDCKDIGQANPVVPKHRICLECKINVSQEHLDLRQLMKEFKQSEFGKDIDIKLMSKVHTDPESSPAFQKLDPKLDPFGKVITTFSGTVKHLAFVKESLEKEKESLEKESLEKEKNHPNVSRDRLSEIRDQIKSAEHKLFLLHMVAKKINCTELQWTAAASEGYFYLCLIVAKVNESCHRCMTNASLNRLNKCASDGDYDDVHTTVRLAIQAAVRLVRINLAIKK